MRIAFIIMGLLLGLQVTAQAEPSHAFLLQGGRLGASYLLGVQIRLNPGWMTYWREPGEAGIPPRFDISGSENVRRISVEFPAPKEFSEAGLKVYGYDGEVVFPVTVVAKNPRRPVRVRLKFSYGVCEKLCVPEGVTFDEVLSAKPAPEDLALIRRARAQVPQGERPLAVQVK